MGERPFPSRKDDEGGHLGQALRSPETSPATGLGEALPLGVHSSATARGLGHSNLALLTVLAPGSLWYQSALLWWTEPTRSKRAVPGDLWKVLSGTSPLSCVSAAQPPAAGQLPLLLQPRGRPQPLGLPFVQSLTQASRTLPSPLHSLWAPRPSVVWSPVPEADPQTKVQIQAVYWAGDPKRPGRRAGT